MDFNTLLEILQFKKHLYHLKNKIGKKKILLYGAGLLFEYIDKNYKLNEFNIIGISDKKFETEKDDLFLNKYKKIRPSKIPDLNVDYILVTTLKSKNIIKALQRNDIKIIPLIYENLKVLSEYFIIKDVNYETGEILLTKGDINFITDFNYPYIALEIFKDELYKISSDIDYSKQYTVLDIGANRGYASLYFAKYNWVKDIYSFELVPETAEIAKRNLDLNPSCSKKISFYNFGLAEEEKEILINRLPHRDGCNTINNNFLNNYMPEEKGKGINELCHVKRASDVLKSIVETNRIENIIFKIDVEGAEYEIMKDLHYNYPEIFEKICLLVGDTHLGFEDFYKYLPQDKFKIVYANKQTNGCCPFEIRRN